MVRVASGRCARFSVRSAAVVWPVPVAGRSGGAIGGRGGTIAGRDVARGVVGGGGGAAGAAAWSVAAAGRSRRAARAVLAGSAVRDGVTHAACQVGGPACVVAR